MKWLHFNLILILILHWWFDTFTLSNSRAIFQLTELGHTRNTFIYYSELVFFMHSVTILTLLHIRVFFFFFSLIFTTKAASSATKYCAPKVAHFFVASFILDFP